MVGWLMNWKDVERERGFCQHRAWKFGTEGTGILLSLAIQGFLFHTPTYIMLVYLYNIKRKK
jgi:hypothetical protein